MTRIVLFSICLFHISASYAAGELSGIYKGKKWGLFKWGAPCEVEIRYRPHLPEFIKLYPIAEGSYYVRLFINDTYINSTRVDSRKPDAIIKNALTEIHSFENRVISAISLEDGGEFHFKHGKLREVYIWENDVFRYEGTEAACGLLEKVTRVQSYFERL